MRKILIVDDDKNICELLNLYLKEVYKELAQLLAYKTIGHTGFSKVSISIKKDITTNKYNVRVKATEPFGTDTYKWEYHFHQVEL